MSLTNASSCSQKTLLGLTLSLFLSLSLCVFSLCESKSALFITPHDASSTTRRSALRRKDIESTMHDFNARKPAKNFGARLFKDDVCSHNKYPRDSVRKTASADFIAREIQSPKRTRVSSALFCGLFSILHKIRAQKNTLKFIMVRLSRRTSLSRCLSLSKLPRVRNERTNLVRARIEGERGERAFANINLLLFSLFLFA